MPTNRRKRDRSRRNTLTPEIIASWHACDCTALHLALGLGPWVPSPVPREICGLGAYEESTNHFDRPALHWRRRLLKVAGWPSECRYAYLENLQRAEKERDYAIELLRHPERGGIGTGCDPKSRRRRLQEAEEKVTYRQQLLDESAPA
jgi:hypothetical protein